MEKHSSIFLGLGTNLGDRRKNLSAAMDEIQKCMGKIIRKSSVYRSAPYGFVADTDFYNLVLEVESDLLPLKFLEEIKALEVRMGRVKSQNAGYESRIIDLDILDYKGAVLHFDNLTIPHKQMHLRSFVLLPLQEIAPNWTHPVLKTPIGKLIAAHNPAERAEKLTNTND